MQTLAFVFCMPDFCREQKDDSHGNVAENLAHAFSRQVIVAQKFHPYGLIAQHPAQMAASEDEHAPTYSHAKSNVKLAAYIEVRLERVFRLARSPSSLSTSA